MFEGTADDDTMPDRRKVEVEGEVPVLSRIEARATPPNSCFRSLEGPIAPTALALS
jgi:hypothetical protein